MKKIPKEAREQIDATIKLLDDLTKKMTKYSEGRKRWQDDEEEEAYQQWVDDFATAQSDLEGLSNTIFEDEDEHETRSFDHEAYAKKEARDQRAQAKRDAYFAQQKAWREEFLNNLKLSGNVIINKRDIADPGNVTMTVEQLNHYGIELVRKEQPTEAAKRPRLDDDE